MSKGEDSNFGSNFLAENREHHHQSRPMKKYPIIYIILSEASC